MTVDPSRRARLTRLLEEAGLVGVVRFDEALSGHTTLRIGGPAEVFAEPADERALGAVLAMLGALDIPVRALGAGSNVLVSDQGARGAVLHLGPGFAGLDEIARDDGRVHLRVGAAYRLVALARRAAERGWSGLEFAGGIPSSVGGAVAMNAGAHGGQMADVVERVRVVDASGEARVIEREELDFGYRRTRLPAGCVVTSIELALEAGDRSEIRSKMRTHLEQRKATQPLSQPSAGSVFVNPPGDAAGRLVESVGLKGHAVGGAAFSQMHANFIVNLGGACAADVIALVRLAQARVRAETGISLQPEIRAFGDFDGGPPW